MVYNVDSLLKWAPTVKAEINGEWVACRPESGAFRFEKLKAAWEVFRGRADAIKWTGQP